MSQIRLQVRDSKGGIFGGSTNSRCYTPKWSFQRQSRLLCDVGWSSNALPPPIHKERTHRTNPDRSYTQRIPDSTRSPFQSFATRRSHTRTLQGKFRATEKLQTYAFIWTGII